MSKIIDFFRKIFGKKQKMLDEANDSYWLVAIPEDYNTLIQYIDDGYIDVDELSEEEYQQVLAIMNKELEKRKRFVENLKNQKLGT